jgi:hypothetical protein
MTSFDSLSPEEFIAVAFIIGIAIASDKNSDDNNIIGNFISLVGAIIQTFAAQQGIAGNNDNNNTNDDSDNDSIKDLEERVKKLEEKLK